MGTTAPEPSAPPGSGPAGPPALSAALHSELRALAATQPAVAEALGRYEATGGVDVRPAATLRYLAGRWAAGPARALLEAELATLPGSAPPERGRAVRAALLSISSRGAQAEASHAALLRLEDEVRQNGEEHLLMVVLSDLGRVSATRGETSRALEQFEEAMELAKRIGEPYFEGLNLLNLGFCFGEKDEPRPYASFTRAGLRIFSELGDPQGLAMCHINLGGAHCRLGELDVAEAHYAAAEPALEGRGWTYLEALRLAGLGGLACQRGQLEAGRALYERANMLLESLGNSYQIARHDQLLGQAFAGAGRLLEARALLLRAIERCRAGGSRQTRCLALLELAGVEERRGEPAAAIAALREHISLQQGVFDEMLEGRLRAAQQRAVLDAARAEAGRERQRAEELGALNRELEAALATQRELQSQLLELARTDPLTGLHNRRYLRERLDAELQRARRTPRPLCLLLLDVDHFKRINDQYGHLVGDDVLVELSRRLRGSLRASDLVARWGGEEFCVALLDTDPTAACAVAEALRMRVAGPAFETRSGPVPATISVGVAAVHPEQLDVDDTLRRADLALYEAKRRGRDRVVVG